MLLLVWVCSLITGIQIAWSGLYLVHRGHVYRQDPMREFFCLVESNKINLIKKFKKSTLKYSTPKRELSKAIVAFL